MFDGMLKYCTSVFLEKLGTHGIDGLIGMFKEDWLLPEA